MNLNREDLAWAAGFYDGEGSSGITQFRKRTGDHGKYKRPYPRVGVTQSGPGCIPDTLIRFSTILGFGTIYPVRGNPLSKRPIFVWQVNGFEGCQAVMAMLWRWLGDEKRKQFIKTLNIVADFDRDEDLRRPNRCGPKTKRIIFRKEVSDDASA